VIISENKLNKNGELQATELELFEGLRLAVAEHWQLQNFDQEIFTRAGEYQGFVDYFRY